MQNFIAQNNVFLHNYPNVYFQYGTTDIMVGNLDSSNKLINNEFGWRGEYITGADGCSIDFEDNANGVVVQNNYIHDSYGAGMAIIYTGCAGLMLCLLFLQMLESLCCLRKNHTMTYQVFDLLLCFVGEQTNNTIIFVCCRHNHIGTHLSFK